MLKVFVLGRPGSGKTTAVNNIIKHVNYVFEHKEELTIQRFKDYEILYRMFEQDIKHKYQDASKRKFRKAEYGGFDVLDKTMFDVALERLEENVNAFVPSSDNKIVTIEFARDDYKEALRIFSKDFLKDAHFLFVNCDLEQCMQRIYSRMSNPPKPDFHFVSEYIMHTYYSKENLTYMHHYLKNDFPLVRSVETISNTSISFEEFEERVKVFAKTLVEEISRKEVLEGQLV